MKPTLVYSDLRLHDREGLRRGLGAEDPRLGDEVLVLAAYAKWGDDCASRITGDFAFAVRDPERDRVVAFRDALGNRPLVYRADGARLDFAAVARDLASRVAQPPPLDERRVADALIPQLEGADAQSTLFRGILRLPPGCRLEHRNGEARVATWWKPDPSREIRLARDDDYVEAFREVFLDAVRCRLDESTASMLSGGTDSSAIVAAARRIRQADGARCLATFSAVGPDPDCEDSRCSRAVIAQGGLEATTLDLAAVESFGPEIEGFLDALDEPFDAEMIVPFLACASARSRGFDAVLDGVDGDLVASHEPDLLGSLLRRGSWRDAAREARGIARFYRGTYAPWSSATRLLARQGLRQALPFLRRRGTRGALEGTLIRPEFAARVRVGERLEELRAHAPSAATPPRARQLAALRHPNLGAALERYHRVAAAAGVEARHPFMDVRLAEFCLALPWEQKLRNGWTKVVVRRAIEPWLPPPVVWRRGRWQRLGPTFLSATIRSRHRRIERVLERPGPAIEPYVDLAAMREAYRRFLQTGDPAAGEAAWRAAHLEGCLRRHRFPHYDGAAA